MSEKSVTRQQAGLVRRQKRTVRTPRSRWGLLLVANSLCPLSTYFRCFTNSALNSIVRKTKIRRFSFTPPHRPAIAA